MIWIRSDTLTVCRFLYQAHLTLYRGEGGGGCSPLLYKKKIGQLKKNVDVYASK